MSDFIFNTATRRYRDSRTGKFLSVAAIRDISAQAIAQYQREGDASTRRLLSGEIGLGQWEKEVSAQIKTLTLWQYRITRPDLTARDYGIIGNQLRKQYKRLREFSLQIASQRLSQGQILSRVSLYYAKTREAFERGSREGHSFAGARWERRVINSKESCADCPVYAAMGWQPIGTLPDPTERCECGANCKCTKEYSFGLPRPQGQQSMSFARFGWLN